MVQSLKSNNGEKYNNKEFKKCCLENGIITIKIVPGTPQHNNV